ncbi:MAG: FoF1 ATP synthase subunit B' [Sulfurovaceae bacterium]|nr:FoF1 ATP synthase subunit B' [Sulfurovaceae bacterium]MDD5548028.1 FoF1 ATP synthase subunit B' [Sulfurovaceae bacterium]
MLDIQPSLMLFVFVVFITLLFLLNQILYKPLIAFIDDRTESIAKDLEASKKLTNNSDEMQAKAQQIINEAKAEATLIKQKAIDEAKLVAVSKVEAKQKELESDYAKFAKALGKDKESLKESILAQVPQFRDAIKTKLSKI